MSEEERNYHIETKCQLKAGAHQDAFGSLSVPIYQTATFEHRGIRGGLTIRGFPIRRGNSWKR